MKELPSNQLDPRIRTVWRVSDAINLTVAYLVCASGFFIVALAVPRSMWAWGVVAALSALWIVGLVVQLVVLPPIRYARWRYELSENYLDIAKGIVWRKRYIIPFIRVQNTDTRQGPLLRAFGLASVTVATAAGEHEIPGLSVEVADALRERAAELARIAQEDV